MQDQTVRKNRTVIVVATLGRPNEVAQLLTRLDSQSRRPEKVFLSVEKEEDLPNLDPFDLPMEVIIGPRGSSVQRNRAIERLDAETTYVAILDDDYVPSLTFVEDVERGFAFLPEASGLGGLLLADGAQNEGVSYERAIALIEAHQTDRGSDHTPQVINGTEGVYGCNMVFRFADIGACRFDEAVPLYGWLEDTDFGAHLPGPFLYTDTFFGVHRAVKSGREKSGTRLGYSQVANAVYFCHKGSLSRKRMFTLIIRPVFANLLKALAPEPWIDRKGRLKGNLFAFGDLLRGRLSPSRILDL